MFRDADRELARLEAELLKEEDLLPEEDPEEPEPDEIISVYNTDDTDEDLADYSEEVYRGSAPGGSLLLPVMACFLVLGILVLLMLLFLKSRGIL